MKKVLLIVGITAFVVCGVLLLLAAFNLLSFRTVMDGSADLYQKLQSRATRNLILGIVFAVIGAVCIILRAKI
ncbi:MAG: hypothetical protein IJT07_04530 [Oscillospiraceae bacterium]|nr:hypothetical protein [Oscillospiraceae bacterium]